MMKLYIYEHCPYCIRARMIFGLKNLPFQLCILPNDDAATPEAMIGKKMVPVLQKPDGSYMGESMDIVHYIDALDGKPLINASVSPAISQWLTQTSEWLKYLTIPRMVIGPFTEFTSLSARQNFTQKKQAIIGSFQQHLADSQPLIDRLNQALIQLASLLPHASYLTDDDIQLFPVLYQIGLLSGVRYPQAVTDYRNNMAQRCYINLLHPIA